jgi:hypothetical protein
VIRGRCVWRIHSFLGEHLFACGPWYLLLLVAKEVLFLDLRNKGIVE